MTDRTIRIPYSKMKENLVIDGLLYGISHGQESENITYVDGELAKLGLERDVSETIGEDDDRLEFVVHLKS